jgi:uncharacterized membrane protein HdeD (DUF308 family)
VLATVAIAACWRRGERPRVWMIAGVLGLLTGYLMLLFAPGQDIRYTGLATQQTAFERIAERSASGTFRILGALILYLLPVVLWVILGLVARARNKPEAIASSRKWSCIALGAGAAAIALTLLASPKQGERLYFAPITLTCAAIAGWLIPQLADRLSRTISALLATAILVYVGWRCIRVYHQTGPEFAERLEILEHAPANSVATIHSFTYDKRSRWTLGDDLEIENTRNRVSFSFSLALIKLVDQREATPPVDEP